MSKFEKAEEQEIADAMARQATPEHAQESPKTLSKRNIFNIDPTTLSDRDLERHRKFVSFLLEQIETAYTGIICEQERREDSLPEFGVPFSAEVYTLIPKEEPPDLVA